MSDFYEDKFNRGSPVEKIILELCRLNHIPAELNPSPEEGRDGRAAYDILIAGIPCDVKADWLSWTTHNICVERESLNHTQSDYFIYALPRPASLVFHVFLSKI